MNEFPKVAIIYLAYHPDEFLDEVVAGWKKIAYSHDRVKIVIVENPHPQLGLSTEAIRAKVLSLSGQEIPEVVYLPQEKNLGFAGGNNVGLRWAMEQGFDYAFLNNQDGYVEARTVSVLVEKAESDSKLGAVQALVVLPEKPERIDTAGNFLHYLGFGYSGQHGELLSDFKPRPQIGYASGAALFIKLSIAKEVGLLDEDLFLYHEDLEYTLRLRAFGYDVALAPEAIFFHHHEFVKSTGKWYFMERNRFAVMLEYYHWGTWLLILPMLILVEIGVWLMALTKGFYREKWRAKMYWLNLDHWKLWLGKRRALMNRRKLSDRELLEWFTGDLRFNFLAKENFIIRLGSLVLRIYWLLIKPLIFW